jgi:hypothetical protein
MSRAPRSCRRATELVSASMDRPLARGERIALRLHLILCGRCRRFRRQVRELRSFVRQTPTDGLPQTFIREHLPEDAKDRIAGAMREAMDGQ